jgi:predicted AAA+ superfamily ATPase
MKTYIPRMIDKVLQEELEAFGAVLINGPKWCGKTTTAKQLAKSVINMQHPNNKSNYIQMAQLDPMILLQGEKPRLIDEWQVAPELWDAIRYDIDESQQEGLYILTGSSKVDESKISHSGTGRISRLLMRTLSLFESKDSNGTISMKRLFDGEPLSMAKSELSIQDIATIIVRGGWPGSIGKSLSIATRQVSGYIQNIVKTEIKTIDGVERDEAKTLAVLKSLARHTSTQASDQKIVEDVAANHYSIHRNTLSDYLNVLRELYIIEDLTAWSPKLRSKTTIRTSNTRHFIDPAFAASLLNASPKDLLQDVETFGLLFESLVVRDLRVYADHLGGYVSHYRDKTGLEADAIVHLSDGRWGAAEIKLGSRELDKAASNLIKLANKIDTSNAQEPSFLMIITGTEFGYTREDGVHVVPIGCLKP